jgi:complex iron-sulfur molybdoenzyme family reductase subunit gamma
MRAHYVAGLNVEQLLDPEGAPWRGIRPEAVPLIGTPLGLQPVPAIQVSWAGKKIGVVGEVSATAIHDGSLLAFRLEWGDASEDRSVDDTTSFVDGAAILLPSKPASLMLTMGAPGAEVNAWYWRADDDQKGRHVVAEGIGTSRTLDQELVRSHGVWKGGRWHVVITRALRVETTEPVAQLRSGEQTKFGIAIWEGSHGERGGIKAFSVDWRDLLLDAAPSARR